MSARNRPRAGGRPPRLLEPEVHQNVIKALELGVSINLACQAAGIAEQSYRNWLHRGRAEHEARSHPDHEPQRAEEPFVRFYLDVLAARSKAAARNMGIIQSVARGGAVTERTVRRYTDHSGNEVEEETVRRTAPDWRAAAWYLERSHRSEYGRDALTVELTGPQGATGDPDTQGPEPTPAGDLAARLADHLAAGVAQLAPAPTPAASSSDDGDVVDGEVIET